jgi:hypothetical protein
LETQCRELRAQLARIEIEFEHKMDTFRAHYEAKVLQEDCQFNEQMKIVQFTYYF